MRILVLGAGCGGLELTTRLSGELGDDTDIVLIDQADGFVFGFSKLNVNVGRTTAQAVRDSYHDLVKPGVRLRPAPRSGPSTRCGAGPGRTPGDSRPT